jgi:hypothetical protein
LAEGLKVFDRLQQFAIEHSNQYNLIRRLKENTGISRDDQPGI